MRLTATFLLFAVACTAHAQQIVDGGMLKDYCNSKPDVVKAFIAGWHDKRFVDEIVSQAAADALPDQTAPRQAYTEIAGRYCLTQPVSIEKLADTVCKYLAEFPNELSRTAVGHIEAAMVEAYPCSESQSP